MSERETLAYKIQNILSIELSIDDDFDIIGTGQASFQIADLALRIAAKDSPQDLLGGLEHERGIGAALAAPCERHGIPYFECVEAEDIDAILKAYLEGSGLTLSKHSPQVQVMGSKMLWETDADNAAAGAQAVRDILDRKDSPQDLLGGSKIAPLSPVRRLGKSHANDAKHGSHMVDIIDKANGHVLASCVYEQYADEIICAVEATINPAGASLVESKPVGTIEIEDLIEGARGASRVRPDGWWVNLPSGEYHVFPANSQRADSDGIKRGLPPAYGGCKCRCHTGGGAMHFVACCYPEAK